MQFPEVSNLDVQAYFERNEVLMARENANAKISKSNHLKEYRTAYVALLPGNLSGHNVCPNHRHCLNTCLGVKAGQNTIESAKLAKYMRTIYFARFKDAFISQLVKELINFERLCLKTGRKPAVRLNAYSDIPYEHIAPEIFEACPHTQFYDYTKLLSRATGQLPSNYDLTYSLVSARHTFEDIHKIATLSGIRCSAVMTRDFHKSTFNYGEKVTVYRAGYGGFDIVNGDNHDLTFKSPKGIILGLKAKYKKVVDISELAYSQFKVG